MKRGAVVLAVLLFVVGCSEDVLIGINPASDAASPDSGVGDSGVGDSGVGDSGVGDSGVGDSGVGDSGVGDSGVGDSGVGDSGVGDSGVGDSGVGDSGVGDSGVGDSGVGDGGPADIVIGFEVPLCAERGETAQLALSTQNIGGLPAVAVSTQITVPAGTIFLSGPGCSALSALTLYCDAGTVAPGTRVDTPIQVTYSMASGTQYFAATVTTSSSELDAGNNTIEALTALTGIGTGALDGTNRTMDAGACFGMGLTSFSMCSAPSVVNDTLTFRPDGGVENPEAVPTRWHQSPSRRNFCIQSFGPFGGSVIWGSTINGSCYEGRVDDFEFKMNNIGVWQGCLY